VTLTNKKSLAYAQNNEGVEPPTMIIEGKIRKLCLQPHERE